MTISYQAQVANPKLWGFSRLLFYWKGSIYKIMYREMIIYLLLYTAVSLIYRVILLQDQKRFFEKLVLYCQAFTNMIPVSFVLGFYVAMVLGRWWSQFLAIPWPDTIMMYVSSLIHGSDERGRLIRRTLLRYLNLAMVLLCRSISPSTLKRFPTMDYIVDAGLMTEDEKKMFEDLPSPHSKYWVPCHWACTLTSIARNEGRIKDDISLRTLLQEVNNFRAGLGSMYTFDWISIPLVYTQVTTLAIYTYFLATLLTSQFLDPSQGYPGHDVDLYVPAFSVLQFFFYMGWIKVAEQLTNPFGEGDDDFEVNWMIDRNLQVSLLAVDEMYMVLPKLEIDMYWDELEPIIPYTKSSVKTRMDPWLGSTADMSFSDCDMKVVMPMETIPENENYSIPSPHHHRYIHSNIELGTSINSGNLSSHKPRRISELVEGHMHRPQSLNSLSHSSPGTPVSERRTSHSPRKGHLGSSTRSPVPIRSSRGERTSKQESVASSYVERWLNGQRSRINCSMSPSGNFTDITPPQSTVNSPTAVDAPKYTSSDATKVVHGFTVTMCDEQDEGRSNSANESNVTNWGDTSGQPTNNAEGPSPSLAPIAESVNVSMHAGTDYAYTPYTNQSTVTSLTPLLGTESQESANKDEEPVV